MRREGAGLWEAAGLEAVTASNVGRDVDSGQFDYLVTRRPNIEINCKGIALRLRPSHGMPLRQSPSAGSATTSSRHWSVSVPATCPGAGGSYGDVAKHTSVMPAIATRRDK